MNDVFVNMGQMSVLSGSGVLTTVGLGSCVGVSLYDSIAKVGGLAHVFLAKSRNVSDQENTPGKYADTAIPALIELTIQAGGKRQNLVAKVAGGAHLFSGTISENFSIGAKNIDAVIEQLNKLNIPIVGKDVGGKKGRKMRFFIDSGKVMVTTIGQEPKEI